jgi:preprotein translocase subunit SecA
VLFESMLSKLREATTGTLMHVELSRDGDQPELEEPELPPMEAHHIDATTGLDDAQPDLPPGMTRDMADELAAVDRAIAARGRGQPRSDNDLPKRAPLQTRKGGGTTVNPMDPATWGRVARNDSCPCGSGKKYKHCHGKYDA